MAVNLYGAADPVHFGTLGCRALHPVHRDDAGRLGQRRGQPADADPSWAWLFFIPFIVVTTFTVLNLFIGIIVNAMQEEHAKAKPTSAKPSAS